MKVQNLHRSFCGVAVVLLCVEALGLRMPATLEAGILGGLVAVAGLPHGALDPLVARRAGFWRSPRGCVAFLVGYVVLVGLALLAWQMLPMLALGVFLVMSAWHFGGDWGTTRGSLFRWCVGLAILGGPVLGHRTEVEEIFAAITTLDAGLFHASWLALAAPVAFVVASAGALLEFRRDRLAGLVLALLLMSAMALPPLVFFALYFCTLHSPRHIISTVAGLAPGAALRTAVLFTLPTVGVGVAVVLWMGAPWEPGLLRVIFGGLFALTVPHMLLVEWPVGGFIRSSLLSDKFRSCQPTSTPPH